MGRRRLFLFSLVWSLLFGAGLTLEALLNLKGRAFCELDSCLLVSALARISHQKMVLLGLAYFVILAALLLIYLRKGKAGPLLVFWAAAGVGSELIFLLRQAFDYHLWCPFCLTVAIGVLGAALPVLWSLRFWGVTLSGVLVGLGSAFFLTSVFLVPIEKVAHPAFADRLPSKDFILIYSSDCPHCHEVLEFCKDLPQLNLYLCPKDKALGLLRSLNLKGVPVLIVKEERGLQILEGSRTIIAYLESRFLKNKGPEALPLEAGATPGLLVPETGGVCSELQPKCE